MLDKAIHAHLDSMDILEERFKEEIDTLIQGIDKKLLIDNPHDALFEVILAIRELMVNKYMPLAINNGKKLADKLEDYKDNGKEIVVDPSKNPTENERIVDNSNSEK